MAYTQDQINAAYATEKASGASDDDLARIGAEKYGVTGDQFNLAKLAYAPTAMTSSPAPAPAPATFGRYTEDQYAGARQWADGKSGKEILSKAAELGLTAEELGHVFGEHGGSGAQVRGASGYDPSNRTISGYATGTVLPWSSDKDRALDGWSYDINDPRGWVFNKRSGGGAPTTGINLSDLQGVTDWNVQPNETVRQQLQDLIAEDSPLLQQARARALQTANARGLLNSSMAMTAADAALYDTALPIAQQDASTYADAGRFNADSRNTFARDNNAFVRDAYMADFNVRANDWAAERDFDRQYAMLDRQSQLQLERDAIQQGYTSARDKALNDYQVERDSTANDYQTARDKADAALRLQLAQMDAASRAASIQPDTTMARAQMQIEADNRSALNNLRAEYADKVFRINTSDLSTEKADRAIADLAATYNPQLSALATQLGYNPESWIIKVAPATNSAAAPVPVPTYVQETGAGA